MDDHVLKLIAWLRKELRAAEEQSELFGARGFRAMIVPPDGAQQDITANVQAHQIENAARIPQIIQALERAGGAS